jgi:RNA polymerase sigma-B factor
LAISDDERAALRRRFDDYRATGDRDIRDELIEAHLRLAIHLARRFDARGVPFDDLVQVASVGLLKAVERFEPERGLEFSTFATPTIIGELKRHFRDKGWSVRVPRRIQELHVRLNTLVNDLTLSLGRSPSISELAEAARASEEDVLEALEASQAYRSTSLDQPTDGTQGSLADALGTEDRGPVHVDNELVVERLLRALPPREQLMVRLRFYDELTQSEIATRLGISQMHVSRLLARCLDQMRSRLKAEGIDHDPT